MKYRVWMMAALLAAALLAGCAGNDSSEESSAGGNDAAAGSCATVESSAAADEGESSQGEEIEPITMYFFHDTACGSCNGTAEFVEVYSAQLEGIDKDQYPCQLYMYNTFQTSGRDKLTEVAEAWGLDPNDINEPAMLINGRVFNGMDAIESNLREQYLAAWEDGQMDDAEIKKENTLTEDQLFDGWEANPDNQTVVYFYRVTCDECNETAPVIEAMPDSVEVDGTETAVDLVEINSREGRNGDRVYAFFNAYQVPEEDQMVPIVFFKDSYLAGYDDISAHLTEMLEQGAGLNFSWPE